MGVSLTGLPLNATNNNWLSSGDVTTANSGLANMSADGDFRFGQDSNGDIYIEDVGPTAGSDFIDIISLASAASALDTHGELVMITEMMFASSDGAPNFTTPTLIWFSNSTFTVRYLSDDSNFRKLNSDTSVSAIRVYGNGTKRGGGSTDFTFIPTNKKFTFKCRVVKNGAADFDVYYYINDELISYNTSTDLGSSGSNRGRLARIRSLGVTTSGNLKPRYYSFDIQQGAEAPVADISASTSQHFRTISLPMLAGEGQWTSTGTITHNRTLDQSNDPDGYALAPRVPQTRHLMSTLTSTASIRTVNEIGDNLLVNDDGGAVLRVPLVWLEGLSPSDRLDILFYAPGSTRDVVLGLRFNATGTVEQGTGDGTITWTNLADESGSTMDFTAGDAHEVAIHFKPNSKPYLVVHNRSVSITTTQTLTAGQITTTSLTGVPTLGDMEFSHSGTGSADVTTPVLQTYHWMPGFSSFTHRNDLDGNPSYFGGSSRVLSQANRFGQDLGWGQDITGFEPQLELYTGETPIGRSGADLADFETNNPSWSTLLANAPCSRIVMIESCINHLSAQRTNGAAAIYTARDEAIQDAKDLLNAAKTNKVRVDFISQFPNPTNDFNPDGDGQTGVAIQYPPEITQSVGDFNREIIEFIDNLDCPQLFTVSEITRGFSETDYFTHANGSGDVVHYNDSGEEYAFNNSRDRRNSAGNRDRGRNL